MIAVPKVATTFFTPLLYNETTSIYPSTKIKFSVLELSFLALFKLYKLKPFLNKSVSGEFIYFANALFKTDLPPQPIY